MIGDAYWINPEGKILNLGAGKHIAQIVKAPERFGITQQDIQTIYKQYNEPIGYEGKAREDIIKKILENGFIRIRLYPNSFWSVNLWEFSPRAQQSLTRWAEEAQGNRKAGAYMPVKIIEFKTKNIINTTVQKLYFGQIGEDKEFKPIFVQSVLEFKILKISKFKEFIGPVA